MTPLDLHRPAHRDPTWSGPVVTPAVVVALAIGWIVLVLNFVVAG